MKKITPVLGLIFLLITAGTFISIPDEINLNLTLLAISTILLIIGLILNRVSLMRFYQGPKFLKFSSITLSFFLLFGILGLLNYLTYKRAYLWDLSYKKINSLSVQSQKVVEKINSPMTLKIYAKQESLLQIRKLTDFYRILNKNIIVESIDVELNPSSLQFAGIKVIPTIQISYKNKVINVEKLRELELTNGIIKAQRIKEVKISYLTGHGIPELNDQSVKGLSVLSETIKKSSYNVENLSLLSAGRVPIGTDILIIWGPRTEMAPSEISAIDAFIKGGGNLLIALDPNLNKDLNQSIRGLLIKWGVRISPHMIIDQKKQVSGSKGTAPLVEKAQFESHRLLADFSSPLFFPLTSSVEFIPGKVDGSFKALFKSSKSSWLESNPHEMVKGDLEFNQEQDRLGPFAIGATLELKKSKGRIVAFGNSTNALNMYAKYLSNQILFLNSISWLSSEDQIISFSQAAIKDEPVFIGRPQLGVIFYANVIILPLLLIFFAIYIYRRNRVL